MMSRNDQIDLSRISPPARAPARVGRQKSVRSSWRKEVRLEVKRSRVFTSRLCGTSAINLSNACASFACRSGKLACGGGGAEAAVTRGGY